METRIKNNIIVHLGHEDEYGINFHVLEAQKNGYFVFKKFRNYYAEIFHPKSWYSSDSTLKEIKSGIYVIKDNTIYFVKEGD